MKIMNTNNKPLPKDFPLIVNFRNVIGQLISKKVYLKPSYKSINAPDLKVKYAGLGLRMIAILIDLIVLSSIMLIIDSFMYSFISISLYSNIIRILIAMIVWVVYNGIFESSVLQATLGKKMLNLKVIDLYGNKISFIRATFRCICTIISILPIGLGIWYITTDVKKRSWHDLIAGSYVIKSI